MGWLTGWAKRVKITIDSSDIDSVLSNFPIMVYLSRWAGQDQNDDVSFIFSELESNANRKKIAVTTSDGTTQCYVEIENWDHSNLEAYLWVKIPNISSSVDTKLYLYFDKSQPDNDSYVGDPNSTPAENVWDSNYVIVTHLKDDPDTSHVRDSTSNNNDGTKTGANEPIEKLAKIDRGQDFDGTDDIITISHSATIAEISSSFTVEGWFLWEGGDTHVFWKDNSLEWFGFSISAPIRLWFRLVDLGYAYKTTYPSYKFPTNEWRHVVWKWAKNVNDGKVQCFINGVETSYDVQEPLSTDMKMDATKHFIIGNCSANYWDGKIDNFCLSKVARSNAWIKAIYETQRNHLLNFGSEESEEITEPPDPRKQTKIYLETYVSSLAITKDDDSEAVFAVMYADPDYPLVEEFKADADPVDLLFLIETPDSSPLPDDSQTAYGYEEHVPIIVACVDKEGVTGTKLRWKAVRELRRITQAHPSGSQRSLEEERPFDEHLGSTILYQQRVILNYQRSAST